MKAIDTTIQTYLRNHHIMTLSIAKNNFPYCATCFYLFIPEEQKILFASDPQSRHICRAIDNPYIAGSIITPTASITKIQGIQFVAKFQKHLSLFDKRRYLKRFPIARTFDLQLWTLKLRYIKMTDNRLGFGTKHIWSYL